MIKTSLERFVYFSIAAAVVTIFLKAIAFLMTGSVGLMSDTLESGVNLVVAVIALFAVRLSQKPPDESHAYGHTKAEYFSSIIEGILILFAAISIGITAVGRIFHPQQIEQIGPGIIISSIASIVNLAVGILLFNAGKKYNSIILQADAHHLFSDVWTSLGVIVGIGVVAVSGWYILDPIIALLVAFNIIYTGYKLVKESALGFMDTAISRKNMDIVKSILDKYMKDGMRYHALRTRRSGVRNFVSVHLLVPGNWTIKRGHDLSEKIEKDLRNNIDLITVSTHLEPVEDPRSEKDVSIIRPG